MSDGKDPVIVYGAPTCQPCKATYRALNKVGIDFVSIDTTEDREARDYVMSLGFRTLPVVIAGDKKWSGYRPEEISRL